MAQLEKQLINKNCFEKTTLPTEPQPLPKAVIMFVLA